MSSTPAPTTAPPTPRRRSRRWYVAVYSLIAIVGLAAVFGGLHWYNVYARGVQSAISTPRLLDKNSPAEKKAEAAEKKAEKTSGAEAGVKDGASTSPSDQASPTAKTSSHKASAKPTSTPGA